MTQSTRFAILGAAAIGVMALAIACGGGSSSPSSPSPSPTPTPPGPTVNTTTITLTSSGASPRDITVTVGSRVTFVNNDSAPHDMNSDPHPEHTTCPEINVGFIAGGQSRATNNLNTARTCTYHDHNQPTNTSLQGTIRIQ
jgi:plastocyanin